MDLACARSPVQIEGRGALYRPADARYANKIRTRRKKFSRQRPGERILMRAVTDAAAAAAAPDRE